MGRAAGELPNHRSRLPRIALVVVLAIVVSGGLRYYLGTGGASQSGSVGRLAKIAGPHRLARARLSGGFAYAACPADSSADRLVRGLVCDRSAPTSWSSANRLRQFAADMRLGGRSGSSSDAHTTGMWDLIWGRVDDAVADLREAVRREPSNARALNDLAVALTEYAQAHDDPSALIDSFVAVDSAVRMDSTLAEARFTHAVLLEQLYLHTDAIAAWNHYLQLDAKSPWATEARAHLTLLERRGDSSKGDDERLRLAVAERDSQTLKSLVAKNPSHVRVLIEDELAAWGAVFSARDTTSRAHLDFARGVAVPLRAITGDALMGDAVAAIDSALAEKDGARATSLANGHAALATGIDQMPKNPLVANAALANAQDLLARGASPMAAWALYYRARARLSGDSSLAWLTAVRNSAPTKYVALRSFAAQYQGLIYDFRSDYVHLLSAYDSAVAEARTTSEPGITLRLGSWLAEAQAVLHGREAGWREEYAALVATPRYATVYSSLYSVFDYAGRATSTEAPRLSLHYFNEAIRVARLWGEPSTLAYALIRRAELLATLGRTDLSRADIAAAFDAAHKVAAELQARLIDNITLTRAHIEMRSAPAEAQARLSQVAESYKVSKYEKGLASAYLYLAQSRAAAGMIEPARAAFDSATNLMQRQRATLADYAQRGTFLDGARSVIDQIVAFHAGQNPRDAFEYFEGTRSRVLLEQLAQKRGQSAAQQPVLAALQHRLTKNDVVLSYAVLPRELLVWIIGQDRFEQHRVSIAASELEELINQFQQSLLSASAQPNTAVSERLYRLLVDSTSQLQRGANLVVIPDRWIHFVPFVALRDPSTGRFLVRDHAVTYASSATLLLSSLSRPEQRFSRSSKVLAVGNPSFDHRAFQLPNLPAADGEARRIASLYADQSPLIGQDATDAALERLAPEADVLHFAGHAIVGRDAPQLSHLVLASDGRSPGAIFSTEIAQWRLPRTRLVILSGCNTADGKLSATEGASSLARAFFAAGVPAVLASLWAIEDDDTADFFVAFHRRLVAGDPPSVALRETQIKWLGDGPTPAHRIRSWAAFQLFGG